MLRARAGPGTGPQVLGGPTGPDSQLSLEGLGMPAPFIREHALRSGLEKKSPDSGGGRVLGSSVLLFYPQFACRSLHSTSQPGAMTTRHRCCRALAEPRAVLMGTSSGPIILVSNLVPLWAHMCLGRV